MVLFFFKNEYLQIMFNFNDSNYEESDSIVFGASILYRIADSDSYTQRPEIGGLDVLEVSDPLGYEIGGDAVHR